MKNYIAKKAVILSRVSSSSQEDGQSLDAQLEKTREYSKQKAFKVLKEYRIIESSTRGNRTEFNEMLDFVKAQKEAIAIIVYNVDRMQRRFNESVSLEPLIKKGKLELHFVTTGLVLHKDSPASDFMVWDFNVVGARSYVLMLSESTKRGVSRKISLGQLPGRAPIGYKNIGTGKNKTIVIDELIAPILKEVFEMHATGNYSLLELVRVFNQKCKEIGCGKKTSKNPLWRAFRNPFYYGVMKIKGLEFPHIYEPLITKELFDRNQAVIRGHKRQNTKCACKENVFRGIVKCKDCGTIISPYTKDRKVKNGINQHSYLRCSRYQANKNGVECHAENVAEESALKQVKAEISKLCIGPSLAEDMLNDLDSFGKEAVNIKQRAEQNIRTRLTAINTQRDNLFSKNASGLIKDDYLDQQLKKLKQEEELLNAKINNSAQETAQSIFDMKRVVKLTEQLPRIFERSQINHKGLILKTIFANVLLNGKTLEFTYTKPFQVISEGSLCSKTYREWESNPHGLAANGF
ncbi:Resolvase domain [Elusimicrobium minutum Pei191]|uniref:Resolvase domain n=1 Tax=Elusimicrobium minutum (strain Pei191) TaxID=445932 RepID=B2KB34_ELUMP|nr:Resolvase domain [Elusimicrobium minutum Pei191]